MQTTPLYLQQAIRTAFRAARPQVRTYIHDVQYSSLSHPIRPRFSYPEQFKSRTIWQQKSYSQSHPYRKDEQKSDLDRKIEDAKARIDNTLESRADDVVKEQQPLKRDETIIHTVPESSSIVYTPDLPGDAAVRSTQQDAETTASSTTNSSQSSTSGNSEGTSSPSESPTSAGRHPALIAFDKYRENLPSQLRSRYSSARTLFSGFMDNFQSHIFVASRRLNDLTGYTGIEALKRDIEQQETHVRDARQQVRDQRAAYSAAIENRSTTQREVNDLLHRKHAWGPNDLERFTNLYRSDHANEQAEQKAHENLSKAEAAYEEASTKLAKSILARYHEEQIWSDKIRQMSTWGTWGLMGLNVLLFIVFQILIEPWRRRRLVRGFEEKVQAALKERDVDDKVVIDALHDERKARNLAQDALLPAKTVVVSEPSSPQTSTVTTETPEILSVEESLTSTELTQRTEIEEVAETLTNAEIVQEEKDAALLVSQPTADPATPADELTTTKELTTNDVETDAIPLEQAETPPALPSLSETPWQLLPDALLAHAKHYFAQYSTQTKLLLDAEKPVILNQRELTGRVLEGAFAGAVGMVCLFWLVGVGGPRR